MVNFEIINSEFKEFAQKYYSHHMDLEIEGEHTIECKDYLQISNVFYLVTDVDGNKIKVRSSNKLYEKPRLRKVGTHLFSIYKNKNKIEDMLKQI